MLDKLRRQVRRFIQPPLWFFYRWYLSNSRWYRYEGLRIRVHPSVFHPGLFFSTKILYQFAQTLALKGKQVLELGAGSGMIALGTARQGAIVTASDINPAAIHSIEESCRVNELSIQTFLSNLFNDIPVKSFDYIFINPPYYPKDPGNDQEQAFFCGQEFEYFKRLFQQLPDYIYSSSAVYMILTDDCDLTTIQRLAKKTAFQDGSGTGDKTMGGVEFDLFTLLTFLYSEHFQRLFLCATNLFFAVFTIGIFFIKSILLV